MHGILSALGAALNLGLPMSGANLCNSGWSCFERRMLHRKLPTNTGPNQQESPLPTGAIFAQTVVTQKLICSPPVTGCQISKSIWNWLFTAAGLVCLNLFLWEMLWNALVVGCEPAEKLAMGVIVFTIAHAIWKLRISCNFANQSTNWNWVVVHIKEDKHHSKQLEFGVSREFLSKFVELSKS